MALNYSKTFPCFTVIVLTDGSIHPETKPIKLDRQFSPILVFIDQIDGTVQQLCGSWEEVLTGLDVQLSVKVSNI
jgi:hypothetical protein